MSTRDLGSPLRATEHSGYDTRATLSFRGGVWGALAPFGIFLVGVVALGLSGAPDERGFWPVLLAALTLGLLLARDSRRYAETVLAGMSQPIVLLMVCAWLLAGVLAVLLRESGLVSALVGVAQSIGLQGGGFVAATFLLAGLVSTATGTSLGTLILCTPLLYPAGGALGANPAVLLGALLGGATFGDNISPVSDTTIASATTQGASIGTVVRTRLRYAVPAALVALVFYAATGGGGAVDVEAGLTTAVGWPQLAMLAAPLVVLTLLVRGRHLLEGLLFGVLAAVVVGLATGSLAAQRLVYIDPDAFGARGLIVDGMERGLGISVFTLLLMGLVAGMTASGVFGPWLAAIEGRAGGRRQGEAWIVGIAGVAVILTTHSVVALLAVGEFSKKAGERLGISPTRRANLLDLTVCTFPFLLPYCIPTVLAASLTDSGVVAGMPRLSALTAGLYNAHSWALLGMLLLAVVTGYGRGRTAREDR